MIDFFFFFSISSIKRSFILYFHISILFFFVCVETNHSFNSLSIIFVGKLSLSPLQDPSISITDLLFLIQCIKNVSCLILSLSAIYILFTRFTLILFFKLLDSLLLLILLCVVSCLHIFLSLDYYFISLFTQRLF